MKRRTFFGVPLCFAALPRRRDGAPWLERRQGPTMGQLIALSRGEGLTPRYYSALLFKALVKTGSVISEGDNFDVVYWKNGGNGLPHCEEGYVFGPPALSRKPASFSFPPSCYRTSDPRTAAKNFRRAFRSYRSTNPTDGSGAERPVFLTWELTDGR